MQEKVRNVRCEFTPEEYDQIKAAAADDRTMKRFCERAVTMCAGCEEVRLGMVIEKRKR